jgi:hypothetical protein
MEPLTPNDPIWKLLGRTRPVETRGNFTQNVMRAVRGLPQEKGWVFALRDWLVEWQRPALVGVAACAVLLVIGLMHQPTTTSALTSSPVATVQLLQLDEDMALIANDADLPLEGLDHMDALVAMENTSALTDKEIAFLLY